MGAIKREQIKREDRRQRPMTLGVLSSQGIDVFCWCNRCSHNLSLGSAELVATLGPKIPVPEIGARLRCSGCGSKDVATRPDWPSLGQVAGH